MKEILISGYYGFRNSGDDALLQSIINDLSKYGLKEQITVLSANPEETQKQYGVRAIGRMQPTIVYKHMKNASLLISGGGTLLQDGTSTKSLIYYLSIIKLAQMLGVKTMIYSNGIGPLKKRRNRKMTSRILEKVDVITLRDKASKDLLSRMGVKNENIHLTADPVFGLERSSDKQGRSILTGVGVPEEKKILCVSVRDWPTLQDDFFENVAAVCDYASEKYGYYTVIVPMHEKYDLSASIKLKNKMKTACSMLKSGIKTEDILSIMAQADLCIGMRLHTLIYSAAAGIPIIGLVYDPKVSGFMDYAGQNLYMKVEDVNYDGLVDLLDRCVESYTYIKRDLERLMKTMRELSKENSKYAFELSQKESIDIEE